MRICAYAHMRICACSSRARARARAQTWDSFEESFESQMSMRICAYPYVRMRICAYAHIFAGRGLGPGPGLGKNRLKNI